MVAVTCDPPITIPSRTWPHLWRVFVIGLCALILCACRAPSKQAFSTAAADPQATGCPTQPACYPMETAGVACDITEKGPPLACTCLEACDDSAACCPPSPDEYLCDGGDRGLPAEVGNHWEIRGVELEDTIAHFDTLDGRTIVEPSNRVCVYAPRFGAVRQVISLKSDEQVRGPGGVHLTDKLADTDIVQPTTTSTQNLQPEGQIGLKPTVIFRSRQGDGALSNALGPQGFQDAFLPHENLKFIRDGVVDEAEMAWLARGAAAAIAWSHDQAVQVILDEQAAVADISDRGPQITYTVERAPGHPKLRVAKVASTQFAEPGDELAFTIRFDNVGDELIGNVTIIDNLTTRLEYIPGSAQCSVDAEFFTQPNEGDSLVLRCEIADPVQPGQGGIIRFRCRVR
jgi:uncharacterized repeat protein (TIGR01451 family)